MKWIKASERQPENWYDVVVRLLPDGKYWHKAKVLLPEEFAAPRKSAKTIKLSIIDAGKSFFPSLELIEWLDEGNEKITLAQHTEADYDALITIFTRVQQLSKHISDENKVKEFLYFLESQGYTIIKK
jgi:hypothetical protein